MEVHQPSQQHFFISDFATTRVGFSNADCRSIEIDEARFAPVPEEEDPHYGFQQPAHFVKLDQELCHSCEQPIHERTLLNVNGRAWHEHCLRCAGCSTSLNEHPSCYFKDTNVFCKLCYAREFGSKCAACERVIQPTDWVRKARSCVFHLACFACAKCKRQLSTGEEFALQENNLLCKQHFVELFEGENSINQQKAKTKRVRTTFAEEQLSVLQAHFVVDSNPDGADLERIASITGLSKRVTQVWFQNSRARQKKTGRRGGVSGEDTEGSRKSSEGPLSPGKSETSNEEMMYPNSVTTSYSAEEMKDSTSAMTVSLQFD